MTPARRVARAAALVVAGVGVPGTVTALLFVALAVTAKGTAVGVAGLAITLAVWIEVFAKKRSHDVVAGGLVAVAAAIVVGLVVTAPAKETQTPKTLRSVWRDGAPVLSPFWWVPEVDQVAAGLGLAGLVDPIITVRDSLRYRTMVEAQYRSLSQDDEWSRIGSALPAMFSSEGDVHRFEVWPQRSGFVETAATKPKQALVFLHGSGGNFLPYAHLMQRVADETRTLVIVPSYGVGNWHNGGNAITNELREMLRERGIDRVFIGGLSNGGRGVTQALRAAPTPWAGAIFVSAVIERDVVDTSEGVADKPILFVHGAADDRVAIDVAANAVDAYAGKGAVVTRVVASGEDHFFWFHDPARIEAALIAFLGH